MNMFRKWGLSVLTMVSVATVVLLVTGWGSAIASSVSSVIVTNPASNPAQVHEAGTANVNVTNTTPLPVNARNLNTDAAGNLKVAEQGTPKVAVANTDADGNVKVAEQGTPNVVVTNFPDSQTVDGSVNVNNLPQNPTTRIIARGRFDGQDEFGFPSTISGESQDVSAYREVTLYLLVGSATPLNCGVVTTLPLDAGGNEVFVLDRFTIAASSDASYTVKTYDPAPPNLAFICRASTDPTAHFVLDWAIDGRTG